MNTLRKLQAFIYADYIHDTSYKLSFILHHSGTFFQVFMFYFLAKLLEGSVSTHLTRYGSDYFAFVLVGQAFAAYFDVAMTSLVSVIRQAQALGTLEALLVTQTEIPTIIVGSTVYSYIVATLTTIVYLTVAIVFLGLEIQYTALPLTLLIAALTITSFASLGIISASFIIIFKKGDPVTRLLTSLAMLVGGVYYPITVLPGWLQAVAKVLPITHALDAVRHALLQGYSLQESMPDLISLSIFSIILLPTGIVLFRRAVQRAKMDGTLTHY